MWLSGQPCSAVIRWYMIFSRPGAAIVVGIGLHYVAVKPCFPTCMIAVAENRRCAWAWSFCGFRWDAVQSLYHIMTEHRIKSLLIALPREVDGMRSCRGNFDVTR